MENKTQKNKSLIFLCTHFIDKSVISEYRKLKNSCPEIFDVILVANNEELKLDYKYGIYELEFYGEKITTLLFDEKLNNELGLSLFDNENNVFSKAMWYNGDYRYYYVKHFLKDYEYYWYTEYDVYCNGDTYKPFLDNYINRSEDILIPHFRKLKSDDDWVWIPNTEWIFEGKDLYGSFFPISRLSSKAIDFLYEKRKEYAEKYVNAKEKAKKISSINLPNEKIAWPFCEIFVPTVLLNNGFTGGAIEEENIGLNRFDLNSDRIFENCDFKIYHPVKTIKQIEDTYQAQIQTLNQKIDSLLKNRISIFGHEIILNKK